MLSSITAFSLLVLLATVDAGTLPPGRRGVQPHFGRKRANVMPRQDTSNDALYRAQAVEADGNKAPGWLALGCYQNGDPSIFSGWSIRISLASINYSFCKQFAFTYAAVNDGDNCWCSKDLGKGGIYTGSYQEPGLTTGMTYGHLLPYSSCQVKTCPGNSAEKCGDAWRMKVFQLESAASSSISAAAYSSSSAAVYSSSSIAAYSASVAAYSASSTAAAQASEAAYSVSASAAAYSASIASQSSAAAAAAAQATGIPTTWSITSCIAEGTTGRALRSAISAPDMSYGKCIKHCNDNGFILAGVEYAKECYCGNYLENGASLARPSNNCNMKCGGSDDICGGSGALTLFYKTDALTSLSSDFTPQVVSFPIPPEWSEASTKCIAEGTSGRALTGATFSSDDMTPAVCVNFCKSKRLPYAGVEYGRECFCGLKLENGASLDRPSSSCNMACSGDRGSQCGGPSSLQLYFNQKLAIDVGDRAAYDASRAAAALLAKLPTGWGPTSSPCIREVSGRALTGASFARDNMTVDGCVSFCANKGYSLAGVEYGRECYCHNSLQNGASLDKTSTACTMKCGGDTTQFCGGSNAISLYTGPATTVPSPSPSPSAVRVIPVAATVLPSGWSESSTKCLKEVPGRALVGFSTSGSDMTVDKCLSLCRDKGFKYAGLEYAKECFCGSSFSNGASLDQSSEKCTMACSGDATTLCGGSNAIQLYEFTEPAPEIVAPAVHTWHCFTAIPSRFKSQSIFIEKSMTRERCLMLCQNQAPGRYATLQYGDQCSCAREWDHGIDYTYSTECNKPCAGDPTSMCGGTNAIQFYDNH